jgi:hypothetical protein
VPLPAPGGPIGTILTLYHSWFCELACTTGAYSDMESTL